jgi:hypothetical protein
MDTSNLLSIIAIANRPNDDILLISIPFRGTGAYLERNDSISYATTLGEDVIDKIYRLGHNGATVQISHYDPVEGRIEGEFAVTLNRVVDTTISDRDMVRFRHGKFKGTVQR